MISWACVEVISYKCHHTKKDAGDFYLETEFCRSLYPSKPIPLLNTWKPQYTPRFRATYSCTEDPWLVTAVANTACSGGEGRKASFLPPRFLSISTASKERGRGEAVASAPRFVGPLIDEVLIARVESDFRLLQLVRRRVEHLLRESIHTQLCGTVGGKSRSSSMAAIHEYYIISVLYVITGIIDPIRSATPRAFGVLKSVMLARGKTARLASLVRVTRLGRQRYRRLTSKPRNMFTSEPRDAWSQRCSRRALHQPLE